MPSFNFQNGHCLDFAIALGLYLKIDRPRFSLLTARCRRGRVLIHAYLELNDQFLDSESIPDTLDYQDLEDRINRWLALEQDLESDETAVAEVRSNLTLKQALAIAKRCGYQTDQEVQASAFESIRLVYQQQQQQANQLPRRVL